MEQVGDFRGRMTVTRWRKKQDAMKYGGDVMKDEEDAMGYEMEGGKTRHVLQPGAILPSIVFGGHSDPPVE
jgi:hypothetical protein